MPQPPGSFVPKASASSEKDEESSTRAASSVPTSGSRVLETKADAGKSSTAAQPGNNISMEQTLSDSDRVSSLEDGCLRAMEALFDVQTHIQQSGINVSGLGFDRWSRDLEKIERDHGNFEYRIGFVGDTGMGKTTVLNAILDPRHEIAPCSQTTACTAAITCFHHHDSPDIRAVIHFKSKAAVDKELDTLFQQLKAFEKATEGSTPCREVRQESKAFDKQLSIIKAWSGLEVKQIRLHGLSGHVSRITSLCKERQRFFHLDRPDVPRKEEFSFRKPSQFVNKLRPYIGSAKKNDPVLWPLVEIADIYIRNESVLQKGITLVDLPGQRDALQSRSRVATEFYHKLDQLVVVSQSERAADNQTAVELLSEDQLLDVEADGKLDKLFVVMSKTDTLDWRRLVDSEWAPEDVSPDFVAFNNQYDELREKSEAIEEDLEVLRTIDSDSEADELREANSQSNRSKNMEALDKELVQVQQDTSRLYDTCNWLCIQAVARNARDKFQSEFNSILNANRKPTEPKAATELQLFPVSSLAHQKLAEGEPMCGFPDAASTGFKALEESLVLASVRNRERRANQVLRKARLLFDEIKDWLAEDCQAIRKLPASDFCKMKQVLAKESDVLKKLFEYQRAEVDDTILGLFSRSGFENANTTRHQILCFPSHVEDYRRTHNKELHSATYLAMIRKFGQCHRSNDGQVHDWVRRMYVYVWSPCSYAWGSMQRELLEMPGRLLATLRGSLKAHGRRILGMAEIPDEYKATYTEQQARMDNMLQETSCRLEMVIAQLSDGLVIIRDQSKRVIAETMVPAYSEAQQISGSGCTARQRDMLEGYARRFANDIFLHIHKEMKLLFEAEVKGFLGETTQICNELATAVESLEVELAAKLCSIQQEQYLAAVEAGKLQDLKDTVSRNVALYEAEWARVEVLLPSTKSPKDRRSGGEYPEDTSDDEMKGSSKSGEALEGEREAVSVAAAKRPPGWFMEHIRKRARHTPYK